MIIVFEGIDGSGKSTQLKLLKNKLESNGKEVKVYKFPTHQNSRIGQMIDKYLRGEMGSIKQIPPELPSLLYAADRYQFKYLFEKERKDYIILLDRYYISNLAHQGGKFKGKEREEMLAWLENLDARMPQPDLVLIFDISPEKAIELIERKKRREYLNEKKKDIHEEDIEHLRNTRETYLELASMKDWPVINLLDEKGKIKSIEEIADEVWKIVSAYL
ncbi:dTMP kinase [Candidatus Micrarchaeota archaeon]|nr:MAG: dTMP kinase [Candidatus Micrarchaeota archaeon]